MHERLRRVFGRTFTAVAALSTIVTTVAATWPDD